MLGVGYTSLFDWEFAGYFWRTAEIARMRLGVGDGDSGSHFSDSLDRAILRNSPLSGPESLQLACWQELAVNHVRYCWSVRAKTFITKKRLNTYHNPNRGRLGYYKKHYQKKRHEIENRAAEQSL